MPTMVVSHPAAVAGRPVTAPSARVLTAGGKSGLQRINHVVVIYEENHSFDNFYGLFPGANGLANATADQMTQRDKQGHPYATLPPPLAAPVEGTRAPDA